MIQFPERCMLPARFIVSSWLSCVGLTITNTTIVPVGRLIAIYLKIKELSWGSEKGPGHIVMMVGPVIGEISQ